MKSLSVQIVRLLSADQFRSGEEIASQLHCSRASVSYALKELAGAGLDIYRLPGRGYRLAQPVDWLSADAVQSRLAAASGIQLQVLDIVDSTNAVLTRRLAAGEAVSGACVAAEFQSAGRGRRGRAWEAGLGGSVLFSLLRRFEGGVPALSGLSLAVGVAVARALRTFSISAQLKWPNDVVLDYHKLAGTLIEIVGEALGPTDVVIGVGINYRLSATVRESIDQAVTDIASVCPNLPTRNALLAETLNALANVLTTFERGGFAALRQEWLDLHAYHQKAVRLSAPSGATSFGTVTGIRADGALMVGTEQGLRAFTVGDISLRGHA